jgi:hypothetical protein
VYTKATKFKEMLTSSKISGFGEEKIEGEFHPVIFRSHLEVKGQFLPIQIILDDSIYAMIRVFVIANVENKDKTQAVMEFFNTLNQQYKIFKYYITEAGDVILDCCIASNDDHFDPDVIRALLELVLNHLNESYEEIQKQIVGKEK